MIKKSSFVWDGHYQAQFFINVFFASIFQRKIVLSRSACLGQELFEEMYRDEKIFFVSQQKTRFDVFVDQLKTRKNLDTALVRKYLTKEKEYFLYPFIQEQKYMHWLKVKKNIKFFMIDSYSELVDQKFTHKKEGWSFCSLWSDVEHGKKFEENFESFGLLKMEDFDTTYRTFFDWFESRYKNKEVFFIHYPTKLDNRSLYKERAATILDVMKKLEKERPYIHNIHVDDSVVDWTESDEKHEFPYHYSKKTAAEFATKWKEAHKKLHLDGK